MELKIEKAFEILKNTPNVLKILLDDISVDWVENNEGENTWSPYQIVGHFVYVEKSHWISRVRTIFTFNEDAVFKLFDNTTQFANCKGKSIEMLLDEFTELRNKNILELESFNINNQHLSLKATHPTVGKISLKQVLAVWVVHDLNHTKQIVRVMAKQYKTEMGPLEKFIKIN